MKIKLKTTDQIIPTASGDNTIGMDLGDRWSRYCIVDGAGTSRKFARRLFLPCGYGYFDLCKVQ